MQTGFESGTPGRKANTITTELKRILSSAVVGRPAEAGDLYLI